MLCAAAYPPRGVEPKRDPGLHYKCACKGVHGKHDAQPDHNSLRLTAAQAAAEIGHEGRGTAGDGERGTGRGAFRRGFGKSFSGLGHGAVNDGEEEANAAICDKDAPAKHASRGTQRPTRLHHPRTGTLRGHSAAGMAPLSSASTPQQAPMLAPPLPVPSIQWHCTLHHASEGRS